MRVEVRSGPVSWRAREVGGEGHYREKELGSMRRCKREIPKEISSTYKDHLSASSQYAKSVSLDRKEEKD